MPCVPILTPSLIGNNNTANQVGNFYTMPGTSNINTALSANRALNTNLENGANIHHASAMSFTSSHSSSSNCSSNINNDEDNSGVSSNSSSIHSSLAMAKRGIDLNEPYNRVDSQSLENIQFQDEINLLH